MAWSRSSIGPARRGSAKYMAVRTHEVRKKNSCAKHTAVRRKTTKTLPARASRLYAKPTQHLVGYINIHELIILAYIYVLQKCRPSERGNSHPRTFRGGSNQFRAILCQYRGSIQAPLSPNFKNRDGQKCRQNKTRRNPR